MEATQLIALLNLYFIFISICLFNKENREFDT